MDLLILGGTSFVGRHMAEEARARGHRVALFHRGTRSDAMPGFEHLIGDRDGGLDALEGRRWDAVLDVSGYLPRLVGDAARSLRDATGHYAFVSTISVFDVDAFRRRHAGSGPLPRIDGTAPLATLADPTTETIDGSTYGGLKVACERSLAEIVGEERLLVVRPGLVVGRYDPTDRFAYWVRRMADERPLLAPRTRRQPLQWIDARDLARFTVRGLERTLTGTFEVVADPDRYTFLHLLSAARDAVRARKMRPAPVTLASERLLLDHGLRPFADLPLWLPGDDAQIFRVSNEAAKAAGLTTRPLEDTVREVLAFELDHAEQHGPRPDRAWDVDDLERRLVDAASCSRSAGR